MSTATQYLRVKNWRDHQHYKDRRPPWIKLKHETISDDHSAFALLAEEEQWQLVRVWLIASQSELEDADGFPLIPFDALWVRRAIKSLRAVPLKRFVELGLLEVAVPASEDASATASNGASTDARTALLTVLEGSEVSEKDLTPGRSEGAEERPVDNSSKATA